MSRKVYVHYEEGSDSELHTTLKLTLPRKWVAEGHPLQILEVSAMRLQLRAFAGWHNVQSHSTQQYKCLHKPVARTTRTTHAPKHCRFCLMMPTLFASLHHTSLPPHPHRAALCGEL